MLFLAIIITGIRPTADLSGILLMPFTILLTALGVISMMTAFVVRVPAAQVYQLFSFPINLILYFASGAIYPIDRFPDWMRTIAVVNPEVYAVHALHLLMYKGANLSAVLGDFVFLAVFTAIMCAIAVIAFRRAL
jgi:ABC-2 type transport system permease protein